MITVIKSHHSYRATNIYIMQSGRFYSKIRKIFKITYNSMDKIFPESGRLSNLCAQIGLFSLKIRKSSAESGRVGSSAVISVDNYIALGVWRVYKHPNFSEQYHISYLGWKSQSDTQSVCPSPVIIISPPGIAHIFQEWSSLTVAKICFFGWRTMLQDERHGKSTCISKYNWHFCELWQTSWELNCYGKYFEVFCSHF